MPQNSRFVVGGTIRLIATKGRGQVGYHQCSDPWELRRSTMLTVISIGRNTINVRNQMGYTFVIVKDVVTPIKLPSVASVLPKQLQQQLQELCTREGIWDG